MSVDMQRVWLTEQTLDRVRIELARLQMERATGSHRGQNDPEHRELRIRHLHELIQNAAVGHEPPDDGVAEPGMVLTVRYEAADVSETFLFADREEETTLGEDLPICSPHSPLGAALSGAGQGERRDYRIPGGETMTVTLVKAVPYRGHR
ncbi:MAG: GreA/GreB family elongation factor [Pseudonocardia sp.]|nr:GreA/GreB family elongation factor [Pseudonocardia sp.]